MQVKTEDDGHDDWSMLARAQSQAFQQTAGVTQLAANENVVEDQGVRVVRFPAPREVLPKYGDSSERSLRELMGPIEDLMCKRSTDLSIMQMVPGISCMVPMEQSMAQLLKMLTASAPRSPEMLVIDYRDCA